jgi:hypothetical protein
MPGTSAAREGGRFTTWESKDTMARIKTVHIGTQFGLLIVIGPPHRKFVDGATRIFYPCRCECGREKAIGVKRLRQGQTTCGCHIHRSRHYAGIRRIEAKPCRRCGAELAIEQFRPIRFKDSDAPLRHALCIPCELTERAERNHAIRLEVIAAYGGQCACCGETRWEFLQFDHIDGGGEQHRREIRDAALDRWLKRHGYPEGFRVLCSNCNFAHGKYGYCPHEKENFSCPDS